MPSFLTLKTSKSVPVPHGRSVDQGLDGRCRAPAGSMPLAQREYCDLLHLHWEGIAETQMIPKYRTVR